MQATRNNTGTERRFVTESQVAQLTGLSVRTLRRWRLVDARPRYRKLGGAVRYDLADDEAWIASTPTGGQRPAGGGAPRDSRADRARCLCRMI
jgi:predicted DNA-binding transcriptional regulator AlpA